MSTEPDNPSESPVAHSKSQIFVASVGAVALLLVAFFFAGESNEQPDRPPVPKPELAEMNRPVVKLTGDFVRSDACKKCHAQNHATWHASYHRTMTQVPNAKNVVADFDDVSLNTDGATYRLTQQGDEFWVELDDPEWIFASQKPGRVKRKVVLLTGSHHEQDFWFETSKGRTVKRLPFVYRIHEQEWYPDVSVLMTPPESPSGFGNWNMVCIQCHTTLGRPRVDPRTGIADTEVVEFGISCEACHGPGAGHIERYMAKIGGENRDSGSSLIDKIVNPAKLDHKKSSQTCGQCHSITVLSESDSQHWQGHGFRFRPGQDLSDSRVVVQPDDVENSADLQELVRHSPEFMDDRFWSDGMVRVTGREYNGMIKSPCYLKGELSCLSCHDLHPPASDPRPLKEWANDQLKYGMSGNKACLQCHAEIGEDLTAHTHHAPDSDGSRCYNCHMPPTTYGLLKAAHSHQIDSPNLKSSLPAGRPNACNMCHLDKSLGWADRQLVELFGRESADLTDTQRNVPASIIWALQGDAGQRALMAWAFGWKPAQKASGVDWQGKILATLLNDPYDVVRFIAKRSLKLLPGFHEFRFDFVGSSNTRETASRDALRMWELRREEAQQSLDLSEMFKATPAGSVQDVLSKLLNNRDDRRVELAE